LEAPTTLGESSSATSAAYTNASISSAPMRSAQPTFWGLALMVQYSSEILNLFGAPELSELTICGAKELPKLPDYLSAAIWNHIVGVVHPDTSVRHLDLAFLRRANAAAEEYRSGRSHLLRYVEGVEGGEHRLGAYLSALTHFEQCLGAIWQAAELFNRMEHKVLGTNPKKLTIYNGGENSDLERINKLNNVAKHFNAIQAEQTSTPIWITNLGIKCADAALSFDELCENVMALSEVARQTFVEIPKEAHTQKRGQA
jgi:hypothetical protein